MFQIGRADKRSASAEYRDVPSRRITAGNTTTENPRQRTVATLLSDPSCESDVMQSWVQRAEHCHVLVADLEVEDLDTFRQMMVLAPLQLPARAARRWAIYEHGIGVVRSQFAEVPARCLVGVVVFLDLGSQIDAAAVDIPASDSFADIPLRAVVAAGSNIR